MREGPWLYRPDAYIITDFRSCFYDVMTAFYFYVQSLQCERLYHLGCLTPPLSEIPLGEWFCDDCVSHAAPSYLPPPAVYNEVCIRLQYLYVPNDGDCL